MITSFIEGRVRIRHNALKDENNVSTIIDLLSAYDGIERMESNSTTGSLLVHYDPAKISQDDLVIAAKMLQDNFGDDSAPKNKKYCMTRTQGNNVLASTLVLSIISLAGSRKVHALTGAAFTFFAIAHALRRS